MNKFTESTYNSTQHITSSVVSTVTPVFHMEKLPCTYLGETAQKISRVATSAWGPDQALTSVTCLHQCAYLQLVPPVVHLLACGPTPSLVFTAMCTWRDRAALVLHTNSQAPHSCQGAKRLTPALAVHPGAHLYVCVSNWPLPLHRHLQLVSAAVCVQTTSSGLYCCLCQSLGAISGGATEEPQQPLQPLWTLLSACQGQCSCRCSGSQQPKPKRYHAAPFPRLIAITYFCTWCPAPLDPGSQNAAGGR